MAKAFTKTKLSYYGWVSFITKLDKTHYIKPLTHMCKCIKNIINYHNKSLIFIELSLNTFNSSIKVKI